MFMVKITLAISIPEIRRILEPNKLSKFQELYSSVN